MRAVEKVSIPLRKFPRAGQDALSQLVSYGFHSTKEVSKAVICHTSASRPSRFPFH